MTPCFKQTHLYGKQNHLIYLSRSRPPSRGVKKLEKEVDTSIPPAPVDKYQSVHNVCIICIRTIDMSSTFNGIDRSIERCLYDKPYNWCMCGVKRETVNNAGHNGKPRNHTANLSHFLAECTRSLSQWQSQDHAYELPIRKNRVVSYRVCVQLELRYPKG